MVLHGVLLHWAFNSWSLWAFGPTLEGLLGHARFVALYVGAGLVGAGASFAFNQTTLGVGASGAIFGLLGALVAYFFRRRSVGGSVPLQNLLLVLLLNLFIASRSASIDNLAHIGGFLAGLAAMGLYDAVGPRNRGLQAVALAVPFLAAVALAVLGVANYPLGSGLTCVGA
jgi:rhomboid protease GluP